jgi:hypothetical protein
MVNSRGLAHAGWQAHRKLRYSTVGDNRPLPLYYLLLLMMMNSLFIYFFAHHLSGTAIINIIIIIEYCNIL